MSQCFGEMDSASAELYKQQGVYALREDLCRKKDSLNTIHLHPDTIKKHKSFKGIELYSWKTKMEWRYSILLGTNRLKHIQEVHNSSISIDSLLLTIDCLPLFDAIFWSTRLDSSFTYPGLKTVDKIRKRCEKAGVRLIVDKDKEG